MLGLFSLSSAEGRASPGKLLVDVSEALVGVEGALDVDACAADLLAASEGTDSVED